MDEAELKPGESDLRRALREYVSFAIILLCLSPGQLISLELFRAALG
jgi:hypothetical protein